METPQVLSCSVIRPRYATREEAFSTDQSVTTTVPAVNDAASTVTFFHHHETTILSDLPSTQSTTGTNLLSEEALDGIEDIVSPG
jgi:hypothetical protein